MYLFYSISTEILPPLKKPKKSIRNGNGNGNDKKNGSCRIVLRI